MSRKCVATFSLFNILTDLKDILSLCIPEFKCLNVLQNAEKKTPTITKKKGSNLLSEWVSAFLEHEYSAL